MKDLIMLEFAYIITMYYDKKFKKWSRIFNNYYEKLTLTESN